MTHATHLPPPCCTHHPCPLPSPPPCHLDAPHSPEPDCARPGCRGPLQAPDQHASTQLDPAMIGMDAIACAQMAASVPIASVLPASSPCPHTRTHDPSNPWTPPYPRPSPVHVMIIDGSRRRPPWHCTAMTLLPSAPVLPLLFRVHHDLPLDPLHRPMPRALPEPRCSIVTIDLPLAPRCSPRSL